MRYEPRQRQRKWIWRIVIAAAALLILVSFLLYHFVVEPQEVRGHFQACGWGPDEIREQLEKQQEEIIELEDYLFYGESLALYMDPYDGEGDPIVGKTLELVNICSGTQYSFTVGDAADRQIYLPDLEEGTYEIYIMDSFTLKRAVFASSVQSETFDTVRRGGKVKRVQLIADSSILDDYGGSLDQHYAFLNVTSATADARTADVMIDPFGIYTTIWGGVDYGLQGNGIRESQEAYDIAVQMKDLLELYDNHCAGGAGYNAADVPHHVVADAGHPPGVPQQDQRLLGAGLLGGGHGVKGPGVRRRDRHADDVEQDAQADEYRQHQRGSRRARAAETGLRRKAQCRRQDDGKKKDLHGPPVGARPLPLPSALSLWGIAQKKSLHLGMNSSWLSRRRRKR